MAPNLIGSTFLIAETGITNNDANNNKQTTLAKPSCKNSNDRVPNQGESAAAMQQNSSKASAQTQSKADAVTKNPYKMEIVWFNVMLFVVLHSTALYGVYLIWAENAYLEFFIGEYCTDTIMYSHIVYTCTSTYYIYKKSLTCFFIYLISLFSLSLSSHFYRLFIRHSRWFGHYSRCTSSLVASCLQS